MRIFTALSFGLLAASLLPAQIATQAQPVPPSMSDMLVPSHGTNLLGIFYLAGGAGPHPTAILFHGFPGFEQNLDLAQALRRAGWNVLALHYRGSWGVRGEFSFVHAVEDADAQVEFVLDPANARKYRIDTNEIIVIGHSMGGFMAAAAAAHHPRVKAAILISAWNIGAQRPGPWNEGDEAKALAGEDNLAPLTGTSGEALAHEEFTHRAELDMVRLAPAIAPRPVLIVTAEDHSDQFGNPFAAALKAAGDKRVAMRHFAGDHPYSGYRLQLADTVIGFAENVRKAESAPRS